MLDWSKNVEKVLTKGGSSYFALIIDQFKAYVISSIIVALTYLNTAVIFGPIDYAGKS